MTGQISTRPPWRLVAAPVTPLLRWAVLVHSVPAGEPWRRGCPHCEAPLLAAEGLGALGPAGRCGQCRRPAGAPPYLLEVTTIAVAALVAVGVVGAGSAGWPLWAAFALVGWAVAAVPLTFIDLAVHRLPDRFTLPAAGWVLGCLGISALAGGSGGDWLRAAAAAAVCGLGFATVTLLFGARGFGLGDAKLAVSIGALLGWLGWTALVAGLLLAFLASGVVALALLASKKVSRRDSLPFGPFLVLGTLGAVAWVGLSASA
ncbi:prepilin peptidase [Natronosporangium hydrolyticum]|uniref:Prepilin peptidase n=1 Tax=Natronosporangium hydrolyticum TaxID=2811111 RepID=A0A895YHS3_9ACTN|nr:A24 family peptidase [Natronosporangium hydrolyticum]QSB13700.1 prepilin peptidase [Natronosporangium hydrolyticum]